MGSLARPEETMRRRTHLRVLVVSSFLAMMVVGWGRICTARDAEWVVFTEAEFVTIPDTGHWVHAEAPDVFAETVLEFLLR